MVTLHPDVLNSIGRVLALNGILAEETQLDARALHLDM